MLPKLSVVLGGASSGKSALAEKLVSGSGLSPVYLATGRAYDTEMERKIADHRARRDARWRTVEAALDTAEAVERVQAGSAVLLDCATFWLSNHIFAESDLDAETARLLTALDGSRNPVVVVSNEVGHGIVPENALARRFRIEQGRLNLALAARADLALGVMAGLPFVLKGALPSWM